MAAESAKLFRIQGTQSGFTTEDARQGIAGKKEGEVPATYATGTSSSSVSVSTDLADLTETEYGLQLPGLIKIYGRSVYVP